MAQWQKTMARFIKTVLWLEGRVDSTRWTDTKRTENCNPPRHEIRNETKISRWPPRHKILPQKSERSDIQVRHVCWNTAICISLCHPCNICRSSTSRAFHNHRSTNIFSWDGSEYLVKVDQYSNFFEVDKVSNSTSGAVISRLRGHFTRYGIPDTLVSDSRPQFSSNTLRKFSRDWAFTHERIPTGNSQANGSCRGDC